jgi:hypothetical protein
MNRIGKFVNNVVSLLLAGVLLFWVFMAGVLKGMTLV